MSILSSKLTADSLAVVSVWGALSVVLGCGNADPNEYFEVQGQLEDRLPNTGADSELTSQNSDGSTEAGDPGSDLDVCTEIAWGFGCKTDKPTYNLTFEGLAVDTNQVETISLETLHCEGYDSAVLVIGDARCSVCPAWYDAMGAITQALHAANAAIIVACTDDFGASTLPHDVALSYTETANPDYVTGLHPLQYPCKYEFTPFTMVIDLSDATILAMDSTSHKVQTNEIIELVEAAHAR
jgi:hypothetical protein